MRAYGRGTDILSTSIRAPLAIASISRKSNTRYHALKEEKIEACDTGVQIN
jgi:hypothetical protein